MQHDKGRQYSQAGERCMMIVAVIEGDADGHKAVGGHKNQGHQRKPAHAVNPGAIQVAGLSPEPEDGGTAEHHAETVEEDGEGEDIFKLLGEKKDQDTQSREHRQRNAHHTGCRMAAGKNAGQAAVFAHGIHHPRIAHQQAVDIGQYAEEQQTGKQRGAGFTQHLVHHHISDFPLLFHLLKPDDVIIAQVHQEVEQDDEADAEEDAAGDGAGRPVHILTEVDRLLITPIGKRNSDEADAQLADPVAGIRSRRGCSRLGGIE